MAKVKVGLIGTGRMGNAYALNLIKAGHEVFVHDINPNVCDNLIQKGAKFLKSLQEMATESEYVITSLPRNEIVEEIIIGKNGLVEKLNYQISSWFAFFYVF